MHSSLKTTSNMYVPRHIKKIGSLIYAHSTVGKMTTFWLITNSRFYSNLGSKKLIFLKFWRLFWWFFRFWRQIFHIFFYFRVLWTRKLKFLNFKTHENLFLRQKFCEFFMSPKWSIFPTVAPWLLFFLVFIFCGKYF